MHPKDTMRIIDVFSEVIIKIFVLECKLHYVSNITYCDFREYFLYSRFLPPFRLVRLVTDPSVRVSSAGAARVAIRARSFATLIEVLPVALGPRRHLLGSWHAIHNPDLLDKLIITMR